MADGRAGGKYQAVLGIVAMAAVATLATSMTRSNPLAAAAAWLGSVNNTLTTPEASWVQRLDDQPESAVVTGGAVVFATASGAVARGLGDGRELWRRDVRWVAAAGPETVLVGTSRTSFEAVDPLTGTTNWTAGGAAVWSYVDGVVSLACPTGGTACSPPVRPPTARCAGRRRCPVVTLTPSAVLFADLDAGRLLSLDRSTGRPFADLATQATVIGYGDSDAVLAHARTVGVVPLDRPSR